jgi:hypothetical protein
MERECKKPKVGIGNTGTAAAAAAATTTATTAFLLLIPRRMKLGRLQNTNG